MSMVADTYHVSQQFDTDFDLRSPTNLTEILLGKHVHVHGQSHDLWLPRQGER